RPDWTPRTHAWRTTDAPPAADVPRSAPDPVWVAGGPPRTALYRLVEAGGLRSTVVIPEALDGKRIFITGSTGFVGTALVERLLRSAPGCSLVLLVRPGRRRTVEQRAAREIFKN